MEKRNFDLEDRLVDFACMCLDVCELLPATKAGQNLEYQLSKSGTAPALIYGEAQAAESRADFLHKIKMVLKEIKETRINLKIIKRKPVVVHDKVERAFGESNELMAIFIKSIETATNNNASFKKKNSTEN
jgi:four helix bundle protein